VDEPTLITAKRSVAARARLLAQHMDSDKDHARALKFAADLDAEADAIAQAIASRREVIQGPPSKGDAGKS
jgi:hypothetical protein